MNIQFSTQELTLLLISFAVILLLGWISTLYFLKRESAQIQEIIEKGSALKFIAIVFIIIVVGILALIDKIDSDQISTLYAAIIGYLIGSKKGD